MEKVHRKIIINNNIEYKKEKKFILKIGKLNLEIE
jgi:hypothetical protein